MAFKRYNKEMDLKVFEVIEEQKDVLFTGRVNIITIKGQQTGELLLSDGEVISCQFMGDRGLRAFYNLCIEELTHFNHRYIVEPEVISQSQVNIHYPYKKLKELSEKVLSNYVDSQKYKPPQDIKLLIRPNFIANGEVVDENEFKVLQIISDYNNVSEIYQNSKLLEFEVTAALVSLRKKNALKVVKKKKRPIESQHHV